MPARRTASTNPRSTQPEDNILSEDELKHTDALDVNSNHEKMHEKHVTFADEVARNKGRKMLTIGLATIASLALISTSAFFGIYVPPFVMMALNGEGSNDALFALSKADASRFADGTQVYASDSVGGTSSQGGGNIFMNFISVIFENACGLTALIWGILCCCGCCECCGIRACCGPNATKWENTGVGCCGEATITEVNSNGTIKTTTTCCR